MPVTLHLAQRIFSLPCHAFASADLVVGAQSSPVMTMVISSAATEVFLEKSPAALRIGEVALTGNRRLTSPLPQSQFVLLCKPRRIASACLHISLRQQGRSQRLLPNALFGGVTVLDGVERYLSA